MIERRTLERRAGELGITIRHVELDYMLHHLVAGFARNAEGLVFRGGTALARVYWPDFRIRNWDADEAYDRVDRLFNKLTKALEAGWEATVGKEVAHVDAAWFANRMVQASLEDLPVRSKSVAIDGTDVEAWATLRGDLADDDVDAAYEIDDAGASGEPARKRRRRAEVLGLGEDGRKIYTADRDARAGHRSAINSRGSGPYVGYELHLGVQTQQLRWTDGIERVRFGEEVPPVITILSLVPAGTHREMPSSRS